MTTTALVTRPSTRIAVTEQARAGVTSGAYEIYIPSQDDRVFFADTREQMMQFLDDMIGIAKSDWSRQQQQQTLTTIDTLRGGITKWHQPWHGDRGQIAYVAAAGEASARKKPRFQVGDRVRFYMEAESYTVTGLSLKYHRVQNRTSWQYHYAEGSRLGIAVDEGLTRYGDALAERRGAYYKAVLAERAGHLVLGYNTRDAGPWHGLSREQFRAALEESCLYAFTVRELR